jgi:hypothetical protein
MEKRPLPPGFQAKKIQPLDLPGPSAYRDLMRPAVLAVPTESAKARWFERKRVIVGIAIAAAFHISIGLAIWLTPPLRLKVGYSPDRWVQVVSVPPHEDTPLVKAAREKTPTHPHAPTTSQALQTVVRHSKPSPPSAPTNTP